MRCVVASISPPCRVVHQSAFARTPSASPNSSGRGRRIANAHLQARIVQGKLRRPRTVVDFRGSASRLLREKGEPQVEPDGQHPESAPQGRYWAPQHPLQRRLLWLYLPQAPKSRLSSPPERFPRAPATTDPVRMTSSSSPWPRTAGPTPTTSWCAVIGVSYASSPRPTSCSAVTPTI